MSDSFADLKRNRTSLYDKIVEETNKQTTSFGRQDDTRRWQPTVDQAGNGLALIRFLPAPPGETIPWVRVFNHGFKGPTGKWYIENSLSTIGQQDPVGEFNSMLWNRGDEAGKEQARKQKRRLNYISNILVITDPGNRENEGKVFLYRYGKKIFDKINGMMTPDELENRAEVNPFDFWEGANFKMRIRQVEGFRNYDKSEFDSPSAVADSDEEIKALWEKEHALLSFLDQKEFKTFEELKRLLIATIPEAAKAFAPAQTYEEAPEPVASREVSEPTVSESSDGDEEDDASLDYFKKLAEKS